MPKTIKSFFVFLLLLVFSIGCRKEATSPTVDDSDSSNAAALSQIASLETKLDSLNNLSITYNPGSPGTVGLTSAQIAEYYKYFKAGVQAVSVIRKLAGFFTHIFGHKWTVISYSDGYCIFNSVRSYRTIDDIINTAMGRGGDCDWRIYPTGNGHQVCLRNRTDALLLVTRHGKIKSIKFIDHPTSNCGR